MLPFSRDQFIAVFVAYNGAIWPLQILAFAIGIGLAVLCLRRVDRGDRLVLSGLAAMWLWTGLSYHLVFFSAINPIAYIFSALFVVEGLALAWSAIRDRRYDFAVAPTPGSWIGMFLVVYALVLYPAIGLVLGNRFFELHVFGVTPCPVTIFTFGILLQARRRVPALLLVIPVLWSFVGGSAAFLLDIPQDWMLLLSGIVVALLLILRRAGFGQRTGGTHGSNGT